MPFKLISEEMEVKESSSQFQLREFTKGQFVRIEKQKKPLALHTHEPTACYSLPFCR